MIEIIFVVIAVLLIISVAASKISDRFGVPVLLLFILVGIAAGSEGIGGIHFDEPNTAQTVGVFALVIILFSGGLDTEWRKVRPVIRQSAILATFGVLLTTLFLGVIAMEILKIDLVEGLLIGAITSSTDAAAVFALLRSRGVKLDNHVSAILELESGSNDPMAVFLTLGLIQLIQNPDASIIKLIIFFFQQMGIGLFMGLLSGHVILWIAKRIKLGYDGLYLVLLLGWILLTFSLTNLITGSGFLAVYVAGLYLSNSDIHQKAKILHFFDGLAWLMQVVMFLTLGLFVFPSRLIPIALPAILISLALMLIARPLSVWICMMFFQEPVREKFFIAWVGLRGAVPIILAIYPKIAGLENGDVIFNLIFFVVLTSVLIQGSSIPWVARFLRVEGKS